MVVPYRGRRRGARGFPAGGDEILAANGVPVAAYEDIQKIDANVNARSTFSVQPRGRRASRSEITVTRARIPVNEALLGLEHALAREPVRRGFGESFSAGFDYTVMMTARVFMTLKSLFNRRVSRVRNLGGIITIFRQSVDSSKIAISRGLLFMAVISINLAVLNVLPIPVLDGGWLLLLLIEKVRRKPVSERVVGFVSWVGLALILGLMVFVTWNDIERLVHDLRRP